MRILVWRVHGSQEGRIVQSPNKPLPRRYVIAFDLPEDKVAAALVLKEQKVAVNVAGQKIKKEEQMDQDQDAKI